jgi:hypothetical protein
MMVDIATDYKQGNDKLIYSRCVGTGTNKMVMLEII